MTNPRELLSDDLLRKIEDAAREQHRKPAEVLQEAVTEYLKKQSWTAYVGANEHRARSKGLKESDVPRLVAQVRSENEKHGR